MVMVGEVSGEVSGEVFGEVSIVNGISTDKGLDLTHFLLSAIALT